MALLCVRALRVPPLTAMSPLVPFQVKSELASDSVKVMVSGAVKVAPVVPERDSAMVGAEVSVLNWKTTMLGPTLLTPSSVAPATLAR